MNQTQTTGTRPKLSATLAFHEYRAADREYRLYLASEVGNCPGYMEELERMKRVSDKALSNAFEHVKNRLVLDLMALHLYDVDMTREANGAIRCMLDCAQRQGA